MAYLRVLCWLAGVVGLMVLGLLDHQIGTFTSSAQGVAELGTGLFVSLVALAGAGLGPIGLPVGTTLVALAVLATSVLAGGEPDRPPPFAFAATAAMLWLLGLVCWRTRPIPAAVVAVLTAGAIIAQPLLARPNPTYLMLALALALVSVVVAAAGVAARLVALNRQREEAAIRLAQRAEFARDLHDYVGHHVTGIVLLAQGARAIAAKQPEMMLPALERIEQAGTEAMATMRRMVGLLREADSGTEFSPPATIADIEELVAQFGAPARLEVQGAFDDLPTEFQSTVHRVVMEALTNVRKHSEGAREVLVSVLRSGDWVRTTVSDDGTSKHSAKSGFGLRGLTERVTALGGRITAGPAASGGWIVEAVLPAGRND